MADLKVQVGKRKYPVSVNWEGIFCADVDGNTITADTLVKLKEALTKAVKTKFKPIPFVSVRDTYDSTRTKEGGENRVLKFRAGEVRGVHSANGNYIVRWEGSAKSEQLSRYVSRYDSRNMYAAKMDQKECVRLWEQHRKAEAAYNKFLGKHGVELLDKLEGNS